MSAVLCRLLFVGVAASVSTSTISAQAPASFASSTAVGAVSAPIVVTLTVIRPGSATAPRALTQGLAGADFALAAGGTCSSGTAYSVGDLCTLNVVFQPKFPGTRRGVAVMQRSDGTVLASTLLVGAAKGSLAVLQPGRIDTIAGTVAWLYGSDGVLATSAPIFLPNGVVVDAAGNTFISDSSNDRLRRVDAVSGIISTVAGNGSPGYSGDGGAATQAMISAPSGMTLDGAGDLYFVDSGNHVVRRIDAFSGIITTVAGVGMQGYSGDAGPATSAKLALPQGVAFDTAQNMYIADSGNNVVREVDAITGNIRTIAGTGVSGYNGDARLATTAMLSAPWCVTFGVDGLLYIADLNNSRIRKIDTLGVISTIAGTGARAYGGDGAAANAAMLNAPAAIVFDPGGNLYIADSANNRIRKVDAATSVISTITGDGTEGFGGDAGPANKATLYGPYSLYFDHLGNLVIADMFHNRVRKISGTEMSMSFDTIRVGKVSPPQAEGLENDGNADLLLTAPTFTNAALDPATTTCTGTLAVNSDCVLGVEFAPTVVGAMVLGSLSQNSDAGNSPDIISVSGTVLTVEPTTVALTSSANPSILNASVTFVAIVGSADPTRSGPVTFLDGSVTLCKNVALSPTGKAICAAPALTLGSHSITASYAGDANNAASVSSVLTQVVLQTAVLALTVAPNPAPVTSNVTFTVTATAATGTPSGAITFYDGSTLIGSANLNVSGGGTFSTTTLSAGTHSITVKYAGDGTNAPATSNVVSEVISQASIQVMLSSSNATVPVGSTVTLTGAVSSTNGPVPTGTVQFMEGATVLGSGTLDVNGNATLSLSTLAPGVHRIVLSYGGDASDAPGTSTALIETIQQLGTVTLLASDANPANAGATVHLTATVTMAPGATAVGAITGVVKFTEGGTTLGSGTVNASGVVTVTVTTLTVGTHPIIATYAGNTNYATSASAALSEVVQQTGSTTTLSSSGPGSLSGQSLALTATVTSTSGIPAGSVNFLDGGVSVGQGTLNAQGVATVSVSTLTVGNHTITAVYAGSTAYATSTSAPLLESITLATTTLTLAGPAKVDAGTGASFSVTLTGTGFAPTGSIVLHDGSVVVGVQPVSRVGTFSFTTSTLSIGTHTLSASYAADVNNAASVSNNIVTTVQQATSSILLQSNNNPQTVGLSVTLTAVVTSTSPGATGSVSFQDGGVVIGSVLLAANGTATLTTSTLSSGAHALTAVYSGDVNHAGSTSTLLNEQIVQTATIALGSNANPAASGASVVFTARVSAPVTPTGTITFLDGAALLGSATLDATGAASLSTSALSVGTHSVTAGYAGDQNLAAIKSSPLLETIQNSSTQIALTASANPATYGTPLALTVAITTNGGVATGNVSFSDSGVVIGTALLGPNGVATLTLSTLAPGAHNIVANYAGDGKANPSVSTPLAISVKQVTSVVVASSANPSLTLSPIVLTATVTNTGVAMAGGTVTFNDGSTQLGVGSLDASGRTTLTVPSLSAGNHSIQASYSGDGSNFLSVSTAISQGVTLRATTTALTATATNPDDPTQVTLITIVRWTGTTAPTGTVTLMNGTITIGSVPLDATGVGTMTIFVQSGSESIVATYNGDAAYAGSSSLATAVSGGQATQFTMSMAPPKLTMVSKEHGATTLTVSSVKGFADTMQFGCLGLPFAATCTFDKTQSSLAADGTLTVQLTVDTGNPLGAGAQVSSVQGRSTGVLMCFLPGALLTGLMLWPKRRRMPMLGALLVLFAMAATLATSGCAGLTTSGTPAGTYTFQVTAYGQGTGASQSQMMTLTVTQ